MTRKNKEGLFKEVYRIIRKIPAGKVATYGQIAAIVNSKSSTANRIDGRIVGWALYALRHAQGKQGIPCHRVLNKDGRLAPNFAFDGPREQRRRLMDEGVRFKDEMHVDLKACLWQAKSEARNPKY